MTTTAVKEVCETCNRRLDLIDPLEELDRDIRTAARELKQSEVRFLVDYYYQMQKNRIRSTLQASKNAEGGEPGLVLDWVMDNSRRLERNIRSVLNTYTSHNPVGAWSKSIVGIGPVLAAGLLAHIEIEKAPTVGHIWRFAGLDPTIKWLGKEGAERLIGHVASGAYVSDIDSTDEVDEYALTPEEIEQYEEIITEPTGRNDLTPEQIKAVAVLTNRKFGNLVRVAKNEKTGRITAASMTQMLARRPWNARLKTLCWKIGESFVKVYNHPGDVYGKLYLERKITETMYNQEKQYADQAEAKLQTTKIRQDKAAYAWYSEGMLSPGHLHARAQRYAVKMFLAHWHWVAYELAYGTEPPKPWVVEHGGHANCMTPPNWPMQKP